MNPDAEYKIDRHCTEQLPNGRWTGRTWVRENSTESLHELQVQNRLDFLLEEDASNYAWSLGYGAVTSGGIDVESTNSMCREYPSAIDGEHGGRLWVARASHTNSRSDHPWGISIVGSGTTTVLAYFGAAPTAAAVRERAEQWISIQP